MRTLLLALLLTAVPILAVCGPALAVPDDDHLPPAVEALATAQETLLRLVRGQATLADASYADAVLEACALKAHHIAFETARLTPNGGDLRPIYRAVITADLMEAMSFEDELLAQSTAAGQTDQALAEWPHAKAILDELVYLAAH
jgi:hypothetical protein